MVIDENGILNDVKNSEIIDGTFEIQKNVKMLGDWAFCQCSDLQEIKIPENVISIGKRSFRFCENLEKVYIPDSVRDKMISNGAFDFCPKLKQVTVSQSREITDLFKSKFPPYVTFVRSKSTRDGK